MAWQNQRPNRSYGETKIFSVYFNTLFHKDYKPEDMQALKEMFDAIMNDWNEDKNPMGINKDILVMKAYAPYHQLYAISALANVINKKDAKIPSPSKLYKQITAAGMFAKILTFTGKILNSAFKKANRKYEDKGGIFVPQNWIKGNESVEAINDAITDKLDIMEADGEDFFEKLSACLKLTDKDYTDRYSAD